MGLFSRENPADTAPVPETPPADPPVTRSEFAALDERLARLTDGIEALSNRPVVVQGHEPAPAPEPEITDDEINAAIADGQGAATVKRLLDKQARQLRAEAGAEINAVREYGTSMLGTLAERSFEAGLDADDRAVFVKYGKEIRALVNQCEPALRGHPDTWQTAFNATAGQHRKELEAAHLDTELRRRDDEARVALASAPMPGSGGRARGAAADGDEPVPTLHELAGADFASGYLGDLSEEDFVKKINRGKPASQRYKDWNDYVTRGRRIDEALAAMRDGYDDGGEGAVPRSLQ